MIRLTPSSTESSDSIRQRYLRWMVVMSGSVIEGIAWIAAGLSETSASLKFGGVGSGSESKAVAWRGAGFAVAPQLVGGFGFGFGPPECGAVYMTPMKNGPPGALRLIASTARFENTSCLKSVSAVPYGTKEPFWFS